MQDVSHTLFYPLLGRAQAAKEWPLLFSAPWAHQAADIAAQEGTPAQPLNTFSALVYGLRHTQTVKDITEYLQDHPQAADVNIGCGLDRLTVDLADYDALFITWISQMSLKCVTGG